MKKLIRPVLDLFPFLTNYRTRRWMRLSEEQFHKRIQQHTGPLNIIIGAMNSQYPGWVSTNWNELDMTKGHQWKRYFSEKKCDKIMLEHVLEHISEEDIARFLAAAYASLKSGGTLRIAVPDGYNPDERYIDFVKPAVPRKGQEKSEYPWVKPTDKIIGDPNHKSLLNIDSLSAALQRAGFEVHPLEYYTPEGGLVANYPNDDNGVIYRTVSKDFRCYDFGKTFNSLIIDAVKPGA
ncbi:MAG: methyltransferase domain-containing protein [Bacteroidetes bacterium]|nr:methyltransferase domain-containing protein [Bacteroidota bacterium]